jgi:hypothetical protein
MPQLYIAAAITSLIALCIFVALIRQLSSSECRWKLLCLGCLGLPLSPLAYFIVRLPLIRTIEPWVLGVTQENPSGTLSTAVRDGVRLLYAPLTEEPIKLLPWILLLTFGLLQRPTREQIVPLALTVGVAFAIGEFWLVAYLIAAKPDPALAQLPWYAFGGYTSERLMTCFSHTLFALPTIWLYRRSRLLAVFGLAVGMVLHYLGNAPITLMHHNAFGFSTAIWSIIVQVWLLLFVVAALFALVAVHFGGEVLARIWQNKMICPECGAIYRQPMLMGLNMGTWRYERCGACQKWHWVTITNLAPLESSESIKPP